MVDFDAISLFRLFYKDKLHYVWGSDRQLGVLIVFYDYFMYYDLTFDLTFKVKMQPKQAKTGQKRQKDGF